MEIFLFLSKNVYWATWGPSCGTWELLCGMRALRCSAQILWLQVQAVAPSCVSF